MSAVHREVVYIESETLECIKNEIKIYIFSSLNCSSLDFVLMGLDFLFLSQNRYSEVKCHIFCD